MDPSASSSPDVEQGIDSPVVAAVTAQELVQPQAENTNDVNSIMTEVDEKIVDASQENHSSTAPIESTATQDETSHLGAPVPVESDLNPSLSATPAVVIEPTSIAPEPTSSSRVVAPIADAPQLDEPVVPSLPPGKLCDLCDDDPPTLWCPTCKQWFCTTSDCDNQAHSSTKSREHKRLPIGGGASISVATSLNSPTVTTPATASLNAPATSPSSSTAAPPSIIPTPAPSTSGNEPTSSTAIAPIATSTPATSTAPALLSRPSTKRIVSVAPEPSSSQVEIAAAHAKLPQHLQLCSYCLYATIVYRCGGCTKKVPDFCSSCYIQQHLNTSEKHRSMKVLIPGAVDHLQISIKSNSNPSNLLPTASSSSTSSPAKHVARNKSISEEIKEDISYDDSFNSDHSPLKQSTVHRTQTQPPPIIHEQKSSNIRRSTTQSKKLKLEEQTQKLKEWEMKMRLQGSKVLVDPRTLPASQILSGEVVPAHGQHDLQSPSSTSSSPHKPKRSLQQQPQPPPPPFPDTKLAPILQHVFSLLCQESTQAKPALCGFRLPFSTIFHNSSPKELLETDAKGYLRSKHWGMLTREEIILKYGAGVGEAAVAHPDETVALCFSMTANTAAIAVNASQVRSLFGIHDDDSVTPTGAQHHAARPKGNFLLQKFVPSPGLHSTMYRIRADWLGVDESTANEAAPAQPQLMVSVCTNTKGHGSGVGVPLHAALAVKTPDYKEEMMGGVDGTEEGTLFLKLATSLRTFLGGLGLGQPIRMSFVVAPSRKEPRAINSYDESIAEMPEEKTNDSEPPSSSFTGFHAELRWNFCFVDLLQLNSLEPPSAPAPPLHSPTTLAPVQAATHWKNYVAPQSQSTAAPEPVRSSSVLKKGRPAGLHEVAKPRKKVLESAACAKCCSVFHDSGPKSGSLIMLRQVLLKWIPNSIYEYPEELFHDVVGIDTQKGEADWYRCVVRVCKDCREEIHNLKTIPARTQLTPWLAKAAAKYSIATSKDKHDPAAASVILPPTTHVLPYLAKANILHPDASGFASILRPPTAIKSQNMNRVPLGDLQERPPRLRQLSSSKSAPILSIKHPIAGGQGTAPAQPHHPKSKLHYSMSKDQDRYQPEEKIDEEEYSQNYDDEFDPIDESENQSRHHSRSPQRRKKHQHRSQTQSPPSLTSPLPTILSPFSSGQKKLIQKSGVGNSSIYSFSQDSSASSYDHSYQDSREREREAALSRAIQQNQILSPSMKNSRSQPTLQPLTHQQHH